MTAISQATLFCHGNYFIFIQISPKFALKGKNPTPFEIIAGRPAGGKPFS